MSFWKIKWRSLEGLQARLNSVLDMLNEVKRRKYNSKSLADSLGSWEIEIKVRVVNW